MTDHIKIKGIVPKIQYVSDGNLTQYEFPFAIFKAEDVDVYLDSVLQDRSSYSVTGIRSDAGGTIVFKTAPQADQMITIIRNLVIERTTDFQEGGALRANTLNDEFDYQIACQQQVGELLNRAMILPPYALKGNINLTLPFPAAGRAIVWNREGTNLENSIVSVNELDETFKGYMNSVQKSSEKATQQAEAASKTAQEVASKIQEADSQVQNAIQQAQSAKQSAETAAEYLKNKVGPDLAELSLTGRQKITSLIMPDFSAAVDLSDLLEYQFPSDGYVYALGRLYEWNLYSEDRQTMIQAKMGFCYNDWDAGFVPVSKGLWYFKMRGDVFRFIPMKGAI